MVVLVGGVSELFQGDLDLGRVAVERLQREELGADVVVEDLHYGAVAVAQRLQELRPAALVLVAAVRRGRAAGLVERRRVAAAERDPALVQASVGDAVTGYVHVDVLLDVAAGFELLPARTVVVEVEPDRVAPGEGLSPLAAAALERALDIVRAEVRRQPLLQLADDIRRLVAGERLAASDPLDALHALLDELARVDRDGTWGHTFVVRDRMRLAIATASASEGMDHRDWGLWWALLEELDRLERLDAAAAT